MQKADGKLKMSKTDIIVNACKYNGEIHRSWKCDLVARNDSLLTLIGVFDRQINHPDLGVIRRGTISYEHYWLDRWYNIFRFHEPGGELKLFYCNINQPPHFENGVLDYVDLDVDVLVDADLQHRVLDLEEFAANSIKYEYPPELIVKVYETTAEIINLIESHQFPFNYLENE